MTTASSIARRVFGPTGDVEATAGSMTCAPMLVELSLRLERRNLLQKRSSRAAWSRGE